MALDMNNNANINEQLLQIHKDLTGATNAADTPQSLFYIYCTTANDSVATTLLGQYGITYQQFNSLQSDIDEFQAYTDEGTYKTLFANITQRGLQLYISKSRLAIQGNIGSVTVQIGTAVTMTASNATVGTSSGVLLSANADRKYALIVNDSSATVYISVDGAAAVANRGIRLNANGGSYEMSLSYGNLTTVQINAISGSSGCNVIVTEGE